MKLDYMTLIDNAYQAKLRCEAKNNKWGINYWNTVVQQLIRRASYKSIGV